MAKKQTITVSMMIKYLKEVLRLKGDLPVFLQQDSEGNGYGTLNAWRSFWLDGNIKTQKCSALMIMPFEEHLDYEEISEEV